MNEKALLENKNRVGDLLSSPLGVLVLAASIIEASGPLPDMPWIDHLGAYPADDIACCLQALSTREVGNGSFDLLSAEDCSELIARCEADLSPYYEGYPQQAETLLAAGSALRSFAEYLLQTSGTASWFADLDHQHQEWMACTDLAPEASCFHPDFRCLGAGLTKPRRSFWTSTSVGECSSSWLHFIRWGEDRVFWEPPYRRWRLEVLPTARVYEVHGPQAWQSLCLTYPAPSCAPYPICRPDTLIEPDWQAVAQDWDGVHLSVGGLLTAERVRWGRPGAQTHLYGWGAESTLWLRWVFARAQRLPDAKER